MEFGAWYLEFAFRLGLPKAQRMHIGIRKEENLLAFIA